MPTIVTQHSEYYMTEIGGRPAIRARIGPHKDQLYAVLGGLDANSSKIKMQMHLPLVGGTVEFFSGEELRVSYDSLPKLLDPNIKSGQRVIARKVQLDGRFIKEGTDRCEIYITSPVKEVRA